MKYTKITIEINTTTKPPYFIGSQLRGALGYSLKKVVCINPSYECQGCFSRNNCLFYDFYELKNSFHKYRFDFLLDEPSYKFDFYLFEEACDSLPYLLNAFHSLLVKKTLLESIFSFSALSIECVPLSTNQNWIRKR